MLIKISALHFLVERLFLGLLCLWVPRPLVPCGVDTPVQGHAHDVALFDVVVEMALHQPVCSEGVFDVALNKRN